MSGMTDPAEDREEPLASPDLAALSRPARETPVGVVDPPVHAASLVLVDAAAVVGSGGHLLRSEWADLTTSQVEEILAAMHLHVMRAGEQIEDLVRVWLPSDAHLPDGPHSSEEAPAGNPSGRDALERHYARVDRLAAANDRRQAALERQAAARERALADYDELSGALRRGAGLLALQHEIDRCPSTGEPLVLGFLDVDGLKSVNDTQGHAAGDSLLRHVVGSLRASLRSYDIVVRFGGGRVLVHACRGRR
jgi:predicted signal transduction protein with EAL and GGDEF domain